MAAALSVDLSVDGNYTLVFLMSMMILFFFFSWKENRQNLTDYIYDFETKRIYKVKLRA